MRTLLIPKEDYKKILKMGLAEISNYLGETQYSKEINKLGVKFSGIELIEQSLNKNFKHTVEKLKRISPDSYNDLIDAYLVKYDIDNIKTIIRANTLKLDHEECKSLLHPFGILSEENLDDLMKKDIDEMLKSLKRPLNKFYKDYKALNSKKLIDIETALDHFYFRSMLEFADRIPRQGKLFREFLLSIIHTTNLLTFFRLKKENLSKNEIEKHIFSTSDGIENIFLRKLLNAPSKEEINKIIARSRYPINEIDESSLIPIEISLQKYVLERTLLFQHQNPLSVYTILSFLFAKEIEIRNLKIIVKAKHLEMDMDKVESLVIA